MKAGVVRFGDPRRELPAPLYIGSVTYRCGYDMVDYAERLGRAAAAELLAEWISVRVREDARGYAAQAKSGHKVGVNRHDPSDRM